MKLLITAILLSAALMEPAAAGANIFGKVADASSVDTAAVSASATCPELRIRPKPGRVVQVRASGRMGKALTTVGN
jgi:hypothetical protein